MELVLTEAEKGLILLIRKKFRYGEVIILTHDGQPKQILKTVERKLLGELSPEDFDDTV